jgi:dTDP-4-amino-4,6-dideoxygalactose transaminase
MWGTNARLDNLHAAVLNYKLKSYDDVMNRRRWIAARYQAGLGDLRELHLPPAPGSDPRHFDIYQNYEIEADRRDELKDSLKAQGIGTIIQWAGQPLHRIKALALNRPLPKTDHMFERCLMLPIHMAMGDADVDYVTDTVRTFYGRSR